MLILADSQAIDRWGLLLLAMDQYNRRKRWGVGVRRGEDGECTGVKV